MISTKIKSSVALIGVLLFCSPVFSQFGFYMGHLEKNLLSQRYQPANIQAVEDVKLGIAVDGNAWIMNNAFALKGILNEGGTIPLEVRERMVNSINDQFFGTGGYRFGLLSVNARIKEKNFSFFLSQYDLVNAKFRDPGTLGIILLGNQAYKGQTITDEKVSANRMSIRELGFGTGFTFGDFRLGFRVKLLQGLRYFTLNNTNYSLYTEEDGLQVNLQGEYNFIQGRKVENPNPFTTKGIGGAIDLGMTYDFSEKVRLGLAFNDFGLVHWFNTLQLNNTVDLNFEGIEVSSLFADNISGEIEEAVDSLMSSVFPDSAYSGYNSPTRGNIRLTGEFRLTDNDFLGATLVYSPMPNSAITRYPILNLIYQRKIADVLYVGAKVYGGGTSLFGFGLMAGFDYAIQDKYGLHLTLNSENLLGLIAPGIGRGAAVYAGLGFYLLD